MPRASVDNDELLVPEPRGRPKFQDMVGMFSCLLGRRESDYIHLQADFIVSLEKGDVTNEHS